MTRAATRSHLLAILALLASGSSGRADRFLRRLQPSALPPLSEEPPPRALPLEPIPLVPVQASKLSPYARGLRRFGEPDGEVTDLATHPTRAVFAATGTDRHVHLWDLERSTHVRIPLAGGEGQHVRFSPDGRWLAAVGLATNSGVTLIPLHAAGPGPPVQLEGGGGYDEQVAFSPDGRLLALDGYEKVLVYRLPPEGGRPEEGPHLELPSSTMSVIRLAFSPDGRYLVSASHKESVQVWDTRSWERIHTVDLPKHGRWSAGRPHGLAIEADSSHAWVLTTEQLIPLHLAEGRWGKARRELAGYALARRPGGSSSLVGRIDGTVLVADPRSGHVRLVLDGHRELVEALAFLADGRLLTGSEDGTVVLWELLPDSELMVGRQNGPRLTARFPFPRGLQPRGQDAPVRRVSELEVRPRAESTDGVAATWSPDGRYLASGYGGRLRVHEGSAEETVFELDRVAGHGIIQAWFPDSRRLATVDKHLVRLVEIPSGKELHAWRADGIYAGQLAVSPDGSLLARAHAREVRILDVARQVVVQDFEAQGKVEAMSSPRLQVLAFSPDGTRLLTGGDDGALRLWDVASGRLVAEEPKAHAPTVRRALFLPDGAVVSTGQDGLVRWWGSSLEPRRSEAGHLGEGTGLAVDAPRGRVLSGGRDGSVIVWSLEGEKLLRFETDLEAVDYLAPSPDGAWVVLGSEADGSLLLPGRALEPPEGSR